MGLLDKIKLFSNSQRAQTNLQSLLGVLATRQSFFSFALNEILPNPDVILKRNNETLETFRNFLYDAHVASCVQSRKAGVLSLNWEINRGRTKDEIAIFIEKIFNRLNIRQIISEMLDAPLYGFKPMEIYWGIENGFIIPFDIKGKPPWWFEFDENNLLRFRSKQFTKSVLVPKYKFLVLQHNATYDNPYGEAIFSKCFYPVIFKKGGFKLWSLFLEKYGMPFLHGKIGLGKSQEEAMELFNILEKLQQDGVAVTPEETQIDILEASKTSSGDVYRSFLHFCNAEISKAILSQTLTTEQGDTGSYAMSQTHLQVRQDVIDADKRLIEYWFNKLIQWIVTFNFSNVEDIPTFVIYHEDDIDLKLAQRDATLANTGQIQFTKEYFQRNYNFKDDEIQIINKGQQAVFEEEEKVVNTKPAWDISQFDEKTQSILKPILEMIEQGETYNEIQDKITEMFPYLDTTELEDYLAKGILIATAGGLVSAVK